MALLLTASLLALLLPGSGLTEAEIEQALAGKVPARSEPFTTPEGLATGRGIGAIAIERPIAEVWDTLARFEDRAEYVPRLLSVTVLDRTPSRIHVRQEIDASVRKVKYTAFYDLDAEKRTIHWTLDKSAPDNGIKGVDGTYALYEVGAGRTLLVYRTWLDSGLKVPQFIQRYVAVHSIPNLLRAIKQRVESGGTWKKK